MEPNRIDLVIDSKLGDVFLPGLLVNGVCRYAGLDEVAAYQVELSVVEAANNAICHAYGREAGHPVSISLSLYPDRMEVAVSDRGAPIPAQALEAVRCAAAAPDSRSSTEELPEGGLGLEILLEVMDQVDYSSADGVNTLRMLKRIAVPVSTS